MAGVVGDVVKSAKAGSTVEHFVTPKKTTDLNQEYVVLKAIGVTADQITDGHANQVVQWDGGEAVPGEPLKRRVKRDATGNGPTEVKIKAKQGGTVAAQMNVWVVWCDWNPIRVVLPPHAQAGATAPQPPAQGQDFTYTSHGITTTATIKPDLIITDPEHPALEGAPQSDPPGVGAIHLNDGRPIARPKYKWDISRQYRCKIITVNFDKQWALNFGTGVPTPGGGIYANIQGANETSTIVDYPQDKLDGNDDSEAETAQPGTWGENGNPYDELPQGLAGKGILFDSDAPGHPVALNVAPPNGAALEVKLQFRQFCRLEIGGKWFRVSDDQPWKHHGKLTKNPRDRNGDNQVTPDEVYDWNVQNGSDNNNW
jgi:hypothetical protein